MTPQELKDALLERCKVHLSERRASIQRTLDHVALSLREETKSTAGDKHETGRAMLQLERENAGKQLAEIEKLETIFNRVQPSVSTGPVHLGSVIETNGAAYFISIPAGKIEIEGNVFYGIGISSPIGQLLMGKNVGDVVRFRESEIKITSVY